MNVKIAGHFTQYLEAEMPPNEILIAEVGAMTYFEEDITTELVVLNNDIKGIIKRLFSGENIALVKYTNKGISNRKILLSSNAVLCPVKIDDYSNELTCVKTAFFASSKDIDVSARTLDISIVLFGGIGLIQQKVTGKGTVFLKGYGEIKKIDFNGNKIVLDSSAILAFTKNLNFSSSLSNPVKNWMAGEGGNKEEISGYGTLWIQCYNDPIKTRPLLNLYNSLVIIFIIIYIIYSIFSNETTTNIFFD